MNEWTRLDFYYDGVYYNNDDSNNWLVVEDFCEMDNNIYIVGNLYTPTLSHEECSVYRYETATQTLVLLHEGIHLDYTHYISDWNHGPNLIFYTILKCNIYAYGVGSVLVNVTYRTRNTDIDANSGHGSMIIKVTSLGTTLLFDTFKEDFVFTAGAIVASKHIVFAEVKAGIFKGFFNYAIKHPENINTLSPNKISFWNSSAQIHVLQNYSNSSLYYNVHSGTTKDFIIKIDNDNVTFDDLGIAVGTVELFYWSSRDPDSEWAYLTSEFYYCDYYCRLGIVTTSTGPTHTLKTNADDYIVIGHYTATSHLEEYYSIYSRVVSDTAVLEKKLVNTRTSEIFSTTVEDFRDANYPDWNTRGYLRQAIQFGDKVYSSDVRTSYASYTNTVSPTWETVLQDITDSWIYGYGYAYMQPNNYMLAFFYLDGYQPSAGVYTFFGAEDYYLAGIDKWNSPLYEDGVTKGYQVGNSFYIFTNYTVVKLGFIPKHKIEPTSITIDSGNIHIGGRSSLDLTTVSGEQVTTEVIHPYATYVNLQIPGVTTLSGDYTDSVYCNVRYLSPSGISYVKLYSDGYSLVHGSLLPFRAFLAASSYYLEDISYNLPSGIVSASVEYIGDYNYLFGTGGAIYKSSADSIAVGSGVWTLVDTVDSIQTSLYTSEADLYLSTPLAGDMVQRSLTTDTISLEAADSGLPAGAEVLDIEEELYADR